MRAKKTKIFISGLVLFSGLVISAYSLFMPSKAVEALEYLPTDFLAPGDRFQLIIDVDSNNSGAVTYSYEFAD